MNSPADEVKRGRDRLIVALDVGTRAEAISLALALAPFAAWMKIGLQLFIAEGPDVVRAVRETGARIFLDLKLHDIPNTVARAVQSAAELDAQMMSVHLSGGREMLRAAVSAVSGSMLLLGVTVLTSMEDSGDVGVRDEPAEQVRRLAELGLACGLRGFVTSGREVAILRGLAGSAVKLVVAGVRPRGSEAHDQKRTVSPAEAISAGADYLVIGRPITSAADPAAVAEKILAEFEG